MGRFLLAENEGLFHDPIGRAQKKLAPASLGAFFALETFVKQA